MIKFYNVIVLISAFLIFIFWLLLSRDNFFHADEWEYFMRMRLSPSTFLSMPYGGHFIPLSTFIHYFLIKLFGLSYMPFQFVVSFIHTINSYLLFLTVQVATKNFRLALLAMILFGFSSVGIEIPIWSIGINIALSSTLIFSAYILFWSKSTTHSINKHLLIGITLILAPLSHGITILLPFVFTYLTLITNQIHKRLKVIFYITIGITNLFILYNFSDFYGLSIPQENFQAHTIEFLRFVFTGVVHGLIIKFFLPTLYFFVGSASVFGTHIRPLLSISTIILSAIFLIKSDYKNKIKPLLITATQIIPFVFIFYITAGLGRTSFSYYFANVSRYAYMPLFFLILFIAVIVQKLNLNRLLIHLTCSVLLIIQLIASMRFQTQVWQKEIIKDKIFTEKVTYLFRNNSYVIDYTPTSFNRHMKFSYLWFIDNYKNVIFISPESNSNSVQEIYHSSDLQTQEIYNEIMTL